MAHLVVMKYQDHLPLNRIKGVFAWSGVEFSTSTLSDWVRAVAVARMTIVPRLWTRVMSSCVVGTDDTGLRVLDREHAAGVKRGVLWVYGGMGSAWCSNILRIIGWSTRWPRCPSGRGSFRPMGTQAIAVWRGNGGTSSGQSALALARRKFVEAQEARDLRAAMFLDIIGVHVPGGGNGQGGHTLRRFFVTVSAA